MTRRYLEDLSSDVEVLEKGTYNVEVVDARPAQTSTGGSMVWLDLKVEGGPDDGRVVSVSVNLPHDGEPGVFYLRKKLRGFQPQISASGAWKLPDEEQAAAIANAVMGAKIEASVSKQTSGNYAGTQQLDETKQLVDVAPANLKTVGIGTETTVNATAANATVNTENTDPPF